MNFYFMLLTVLQTVIIITLAIAYIRSRRPGKASLDSSFPNSELELYERIMSSSTDFMSFVDSNYTYRAVNQRYLTIFNKTREQIVGQQVALLHGQDQFEKRIKPNLDRCLRGESFHVQNWLVFPNIGPRFIDVYHAPFSAMEGEYSGVVLCTRDITKQKLAEEKISTAFRSCPDAITIASLSTGLYLEVNDAFTEITGYKRKEVIGSALSDLNLWLNTEDRANFVSQLKNNRKLCDFEVDFRIKSGEIRRMQISAEIIDIHNETCILDFTRDITTQKFADEALKISHQQFKASFQHAPIGIFLADKSTTLIKANQAACNMYGYTSDELEGKTLSQFTHPEDLEKATQNLQKITIGEVDHFQLEKRYKHKDGEYFWANVNVSAVRNTDEKPLLLISQVEDITERKQAEETLHNIADGVSSATGKKFFLSLVTHLAATLKVKYVIICELVKNDPPVLRSVANCINGEIQASIEYQLSGTPCQVVMENGENIYADNVQQVFPELSLLEELGAVGYIGAPLIGSNGNVLGLIAVLHNEAIKNVSVTESMLLIFATRAAAELERMSAENELRLYEQIVSSASDCMAFVDTNYKYQAVNNSYTETFQLPKEEIIGKSVSTILGEKYFESKAKPRLNKCLSGQFVNLQEWVEIPGIGRRYLDLRYSPFYEENNLVSGIVVCIRDITESQVLSEQLVYQAAHDDLTSLINRSEFEKRLHTLLKKARADNSQHALCYMDLDHFKLVNDSCGHIAGDELLRQLSDLLRGDMRYQDSLARLGGDEFAMLIENSDIDSALATANKLRELVDHFDFTWEGKRFKIGISIGLVAINEMSGNTIEVIKQADAACYSAKEQGRNRIYTYQYDDTDLKLRRGEMNWVMPVQQALESEEFSLYTQPIIPVNAKKDEKKINEILIRMDVNGELILPETFLGTTERYGLASKLDVYVIKNTFMLLEKYKDKMDSLYLCSINLSGHSLGEKDVLEFILDMFQSSMVAPENICFEITETAAITNLSHAKRFIDILKRKGCLFALDDFGSGFSSFAYLKNLHVDFLKIDGMFVKDMAHDPIDFAMVKSINEIGHVMGMKTIAEFVEDEKTMTMLKEIGVDYAQGFHLGMPEHFETLLDIPRS